MGAHSGNVRTYVTGRTYVRTSVPTDSAGGSPKTTRWGVENASFPGRKLHGAFGQLAFFLAGNRMTIVAFEKEVSKRLYESTEEVDKKNI